MTAREHIKAAMRLIGVLASGENPSADEASDALGAFNRMLGTWANDGLLVYQKTRETFSLVAAQQMRTIGSGGNFSTSRPVLLLNAGIIVNSIEYPVDLINTDQWAAIQNKSVTSEIPSKIYYEPESPLGKLYFWPVPSAANSVALYSNKPFSTLTLETDISYPTGYDAAIVSNLAKIIAPEFGKSISQELAEEAINSKSAIMRTNTKEVFMTSDAAGLTQSDKKPFNIYTGV